jgi:hypothetical protein
MVISEANRSRFQMIGKDRLALALATGTIHTLGVSEAMKAEAIEWVNERDAERDSARQLEVRRYNAVLRWTIVAAVASLVAAITGIVAVITGIIALVR